MTATADVETFQGRPAEIAVSTWPNPEPRRIVILAHGYGEHLGRYDHVAEVLVGRGAVVAGPDHVGHGRSGGERVIVTDSRRRRPAHGRAADEGASPRPPARADRPLD